MTFVALLRAVNVSGRNRVPMAELRARLEAAGFAGVQTYVQSGNVVFKAASDDPAEHAATIRGLIEREFGGDVGVQVLTATELAQVAAANPFAVSGSDEKALHVTFLEGPAPVAAFGGLDLPAQPGERAELGGRVVYLYLPHGYGRTKLNNAYLERALKTSATTRNWRTVLTLAQMSARGA